MTGQKCLLTGHFFTLPVILTGHIFSTAQNNINHSKHKKHKGRKCAVVDTMGGGGAEGGACPPPIIFTEVLVLKSGSTRKFSFQEVKPLLII